MTQREGRALKLENYLPLSKKANFFPLPSFTKITKFHDFPLLLVFPIQNRRAAKNPLKYIRQMKSIRSIKNKCISFCETMNLVFFFKKKYIIKNTSLHIIFSKKEQHQLQLNSQSSTSMKSQNTYYVTLWCNGSAKSLQETVGNSRWV